MNDTTARIASDIRAHGDAACRICEKAVKMAKTHFFAKGTSDDTLFFYAAAESYTDALAMVLGYDFREWDALWAYVLDQAERRHAQRPRTTKTA